MLMRLMKMVWKISLLGFGVSFDFMLITEHQYPGIVIIITITEHTALTV